LGWKDEELEKTYNVYLAVYVIAQALQDIINCAPGQGLLKASSVFSMLLAMETSVPVFDNPM